jgi:hypothetical protein
MGAPERDIAQAKDFIAPPGYQRHRPEATLLYRVPAQSACHADAAAKKARVSPSARLSPGGK